MTREQLRKLREWDLGPHRVTSLYLSVDGRHRSRPEYETALKNLLAEGREQIQALSDRELQQSVERDLEQIQHFVSREFRSSNVRGLALFSCSARGLWAGLEVPMPVRDRIVIGGAPYLRPLEAMADEHHSFCVALCDSRRARLFILHMGELQEYSEIRDEVPARIREGGSSARSGSGRSRVWQGTSDSRIDRHIDWHVQQHLNRVGEAVLELYNQEHFGHLMLAGPEEIMSDLQEVLHTYLQKILVGQFSCAVSAPTEEVRRAARKLEQEYDASTKRDRVESLLEKAGSRSFGVVGLAETLEALAMGAVHTLIVSQSFTSAGQQCQDCGTLNAREGAQCLSCGSSSLEEVDDVVAEVIANAIDQRCEIVRVGDSPDLEAAGGIGAILRFRWWEAASPSQTTAAE